MVAVVEKWNAYTKQRQDLWGFGDILAIRGNETLIVQTTSGVNVSKRIQKIGSHPCNVIAEFWLESPTRRIEVHGWRKVGPRGKRKVWECRVMSATLEVHPDGNRIVWSSVNTTQ